MAEMIPLQYRVRVATRRRLTRWAFWAAVVVALCSVSVGAAYTWESRAVQAAAELRARHDAQASLIQRSQELKAKREYLAGRKATIHQLKDDKVLLALLHSMSNEFKSCDLLEYVHIDARGTSQQGKPAQPGRYVVQLSGITANMTTLGELMKRLARNTRPGVTVLLQHPSKRETYLDGQVMRFQITCEKVDAVAKL